MLHRPFDCKAIYAGFAKYDDWRDDALEATAALIKWHRTPASKRKCPAPEFSKVLYGKTKDSLKEYFSENCAYCEAPYAAVAWGDVEHYRPKGSVEEDKKHPGYYWLAYDESNLLPSCAKCNQGGAKVDRFPIAGRRAYSPKDAIPKEKPLLLNPYEPKDCWGSARPHFEYDFVDPHKPMPTGCLKALTERGKRTIEILRLDRSELNRQRRGAQWDVFIALDAAKRSKIDVLCRAYFGDRPYASAVRAAVQVWRRAKGLSLFTP